MNCFERNTIREKYCKQKMIFRQKKSQHLSLIGQRGPSEESSKTKKVIWFRLERFKHQKYQKCFTQVLLKNVIKEKFFSNKQNRLWNGRIKMFLRIFNFNKKEGFTLKDRSRRSALSANKLFWNVRKIHRKKLVMKSFFRKDACNVTKKKTPLLIFSCEFSVNLKF